MSKVWVIRDKATNKVLAVHVSNGNTLFHWRKQCEDDGYETTVTHEEQDNVGD